MTKVFTDVVFEVGMEGDPPLTVKPDPDCPSEWVRLEAKDAGHWGPVDLGVPKELAIALGRALIKCAEGLGGEA